MSRELGAEFFLDTSGAALAAAIEHGVDMIKPNLREMRELTGASLSNEGDWITAARGYINSGQVGAVALSLGHLGAMLIARDQALRSLPPSIKPGSAPSGPAIAFWVQSSTAWPRASSRGCVQARRGCGLSSSRSRGNRCPYRKSNPHILMVQSTKDRHRASIRPAR